MNQLSLNGAWTLTRPDQPQWELPAQVPGCVHLDLLTGGELQDPYYRDNEKAQFWVGETDWVYRRSFEVSPDLLAHEQVLLRAHGLDTLAHVRLNGEEIGYADNMYRTWEWDIKAQLKPGANEVEIYFDAPMTYARRMDAERGEMAAWVGNMRLVSGAWIRKEPCNFGWDWGPKCVTSGIWRSLELIAFDSARLGDVLILQDHTKPERVKLDVRGSVEQASSADLAAVVTIMLDGKKIVSTDPLRVEANMFTAEIVIDDPQLWWVNGMGEQPLYTVTVQLCKGDQEVDSWTRRIGLRVLKLERRADEWGQSFYFSINGVPFFAKGANWIPADPFAPRLTDADYERLIQDTVAANMNMLRVWGGGIYEDDTFYDLCDEYGVAIWQDFMFACGTYPAFDAEFMANVEAEARDNVRRMRHHACMALWCGNNELEQGMPSQEWKESLSWEQYGKLFDVLLPGVVKQLDPQRDYWPCSPHSPLGDREDWMNQGWGDTHLWAVWHGKQPFEWYRTRQDRFCSEFGFQSFPEPAVISDFAPPEDWNITSYVMEYHQRSDIGNSTIIHYMLDWFRLPTSFEATVWLSQILQGMAMKYAVEHWRRHMPRTMGTLYWQLNDCWPAPSWASVDYKGNWKALHYMAKRFYAPLLVSGVEDPATGSVAVYVNSDRQKALSGIVRWTLTTAGGATIETGEQTITTPVNGSAKVATLDCNAAMEKYGARDLLVWLSLTVEGEAPSENLVLFARPKHLQLVNPELKVEISGAGEGQYAVTVTAQNPALFVWLELPGARFSDNFFDLRPSQSKQVTITSDKDLAAVQRDLKAQSVVDTYQ